MLSNAEISVGLFPGQGGYRSGTLHARWSARSAPVREVFDEVDEAAEQLLGRTVSSRIFTDPPPTPEELFARDPEILQAAVYGVSVALYRLLRAEGANLSVLVGHSLGEISAVACAGALDVATGAAVVCHRVAATTAAAGMNPPGGMVALSCSAETAEKILALARSSDAVVASDNAPEQVVVSAPMAALATVEAIAAATGISTRRLLAPVAFHSPALSNMSADFTRRIRGIVQQPFDVPVYSPILGRFYRDTDSLPDLLARHLTSPLPFGPAMRRLHSSGARLFVEVGAGHVLTGLVSQAFPEATVLALDRDLAGAALFLGGPASLNGASTPPAAPSTRILPSPPRQHEPIPQRVTPQRGSGAAAHQAEAAPVSRAEPTLSREEVLGTVRRVYAEALDYPEEVLTDDAHLDADLGVDSLKRTELVVRLIERFGLTTDEVEEADGETFGAVVDLFHQVLVRKADHGAEIPTA
ncbi:acyltransferase domain-containing protein [Streptomyces sp. NPDC001719]